MTSRPAVDLPKEAGTPVRECLDLERRKVVSAPADRPRTEADAPVREHVEPEPGKVASGRTAALPTEADAPVHECLGLERRKLVSAPGDRPRTEADAPIGDWLDPERKAASDHVFGTQDTRVRGPVQGRAVLDRAARAPGGVAHGEGPPPRRGGEAQEGAARPLEALPVAVQAGGARPRGRVVTSAGEARSVRSVPGAGEAGSARSREVVVRGDPAPVRAMGVEVGGAEVGAEPARASAW